MRLAAVLGAILGPSWSHLGAILGPLGAILGPSWDHLGRILGVLSHLGDILEASWRHLGPKECPGGVGFILGAILGPQNSIFCYCGGCF